MGLTIDALNGIAVATRDQARAAASDEALSYIKKRYKLPLVSWGNDLKEAVAAIASWKLLKNRGFNPIAGSDDNIVKGHEDAIAWLTKVSKGTVELVDCVDSSPELEEQGPLVSTSTGGALWPNFGGGFGGNGGCGGC